MYRSNRPEVFLGKSVLKICSKFTREHPCRSVISIKLLYNIKYKNIKEYIEYIEYKTFVLPSKERRKVTKSSFLCVEKINNIIFLFGKNHSCPGPVEQLIKQEPPSFTYRSSFL